MVIQDLINKLIDKDMASCQRIPTCSIWVDTLKKEMDTYKEWKEVLMEGTLNGRIKG